MTLETDSTLASDAITDEARPEIEAPVIAETEAAAAQPAAPETAEPALASRAFWGSPPVVGLVMLIVGLLVGYFGRPGLEAQFTTPAPAAAGPMPLPRTREELMPFLIKQTRHFKGEANAPVVLIEFADFQCPFCGQHTATAGRQIQAQYVNTGKVRLGYQHYTFLGSESVWAAEASECAADQNAFWAYHDTLYANQNGENQGAFNKDRLKQFAGTLGLDQKSFDDCLDSGKYTSLVVNQTQTLGTLGVSSTPAFVVNGEVLIGALAFETFQEAIDEALGAVP